MEFGSLSNLGWGLLAIPIIIFYILKVRLRRTPVSTVMFWEQVFQDKRPRSLWQQLRHLVSLLCQLAFLALLVFALLDPFWSWEKRTARRVVLVLDNSASMNAGEGSSRLHQAREEGLRMIRGLRARDQMAIVSAGGAPKVACGLTGHQRTLREALNNTPSTDSPTQVSDAVDLARRLLADQENTEIIVLTDGCFAAARDLDAAEDVKLAKIGDAADNVGITQFQTRRSLLDSVGYQILVEVANFSSEPQKTRLEIDLNDEVVDIVPLELEPEEKWMKAIDQTSSTGGRLVARLTHDDVLKTDNHAVAILPRRQPQPVLLVTKGSLYLQKVLEAIPLVELTMTETPPETIPGGTIVIYHGVTPEMIPPGRVMVIQPTSSNEYWQVGPPLDNPIVAEQNKDSELMTHVRLDNVLMPEANRLTIEAPHEVLASSLAETPLYCSIKRKQGKMLVMTVALAKGDLPLRTAFPIMMTNAISWFQGDKGELRQAIAAGRTVEVDLLQIASGGEKKASAGEASADASMSDFAGDRFVLRSPTGAAFPLPSGVVKTTAGPLNQCGVWTIEKQADDAEASQPNAAPLMEFACNLSNPDESDLRTSLEDRTALQASVWSLGGWPIWLYAALAAALFSAVEWGLYQRRWIS